MTYDEALVDMKALTPTKLREFAVVCEGRAAMTLAECYREPIYEQAGRLLQAAEMLRARDTFFGRANMIDNFGPTQVEHAEELRAVKEEEAAWPRISAELRAVAGADPKLLPLVEQIDKLHELAEERGLPVITRRQFEEELERAA